MSKELPYFKFYITDWLIGNITLQDMATQGVFINICVLFWSRDCDLTYQNCMERFKKSERKLIENLIKVGIIKLENDKIVIEFLEKQLKIREELSKNNKKNVEKRYQSTENIEKNSTTVDESVYNIEERIIRGEDNKIRKENIIKENNIDSRKLKFASTLKPFLEKYGKDLLNNFYAYWTEPNKSNTKFRQELEKAWDIDRRLATWASRDKNFIKQTEQQTAKKRHQPT